VYILVTLETKSENHRKVAKLSTRKWKTGKKNKVKLDPVNVSSAALTLFRAQGSGRGL